MDATSQTMAAQPASAQTGEDRSAAQSAGDVVQYAMGLVGGPKALALSSGVETGIVVTAIGGNLSLPRDTVDAGKENARWVSLKAKKV